MLPTLTPKVVCVCSTQSSRKYVPNSCKKRVMTIKAACCPAQHVLVHYLILNCRKIDGNVIWANSCCGPCHPKGMFKNRAALTDGFWLSLALWKWLSWDAVPNGCSSDGSSLKEACSRDLSVPPAQDYSISWSWPLLPFVPWWSVYLVLIWGP